MSSSPVWVWTPHFSRATAAARLKSNPGIRIIHFDQADPEKMLLLFRRIREDVGDQPVTVFDLARFPDGREWSYVTDGVNRSGANPLRGLGAVMREPFIDVSQLYNVPTGELGLEVVSLGARYDAAEDNPLPDSRGRPVCGYLQDAAILAHTEGLAVNGVLVAESYVPHFDFSQFQ
ncbi:MAG: hypothetical protein JSU77_10830 [Fidelibacterota bacterium]|nr:MAG: hypothetical protein JSU77_10830 [Candidatus Neomarinimicrobiota bacterium]